MVGGIQPRPQPGSVQRHTQSGVDILDTIQPEASSDPPSPEASVLPRTARRTDALAGKSS